MIVLGCTGAHFPRKLGTIPFLPVGMGVASMEVQRSAFRRLVGRGEQVTLVHARSDRRNGREAFPSPWLTEFSVTAPLQLRSSQELLQRFGPRTASQLRTVEAISSGRVGRPGARLREAWEGDLVAEAAAARDLSPTLPISPSQLETFFDCPRRWFFHYVEKLEEPEATPPFGLSPMAMGSAVHTALNALFARRRQELQDPDFRWNEDDYAFAWSELQRLAALADPRPGVKPVEAELRRVGAQLRRMLERDSNYRHALAARPIGTELRLRGHIAGMEVAGKADRIDRVRVKGGEGEGVNVIDYKTGHGAPPNKADPTRGGTTLQALLYAELARQNGGKLGFERVRAATGEYWYLGRPLQEMAETHELNETSQARLQELLRVAGDMMRDGLVPMRPTRPVDALCEYCAYRKICPGEREAIVARQSATATGSHRQFLRLVGQEPE